MALSNELVEKTSSDTVCLLNLDIVPVEIIETPEAKLSRRESPASLVFLWQIDAKAFLLLDYVPLR
jgi:hypothetical protein